jgi:hypothetical protein
MTPNQQNLIESLAGRSMTQAEINEAELRNDAALAISLSIGRTINNSVSTPLFAAWCSSTGLRATIQDAATNSTSPLRSGALAILDLLSWATGSLDLSASVMGQSNLVMLSHWVAAGVVTQTQSDMLVALSKVSNPIDVNTISNILGSN